jgi:hypothetical protein
MKEAVDDLNWTLPYFLCPDTGYLFFSTIYNSTLLLTTASVKHFLSVAYPVRFRAPGRVDHTQWACVVFWILSLAHCRCQQYNLLWEFHRCPSYYLSAGTFRDVPGSLFIYLTFI